MGETKLVMVSINLITFAFRKKKKTTKKPNHLAADESLAEVSSSVRTAVVGSIPKGFPVTFTLV